MLYEARGHRGTCSPPKNKIIYILMVFNKYNIIYFRALVKYLFIFVEISNRLVVSICIVLPTPLFLKFQSVCDTDLFEINMHSRHLVVVNNKPIPHKHSINTFSTNYLLTFKLWEKNNNQLFKWPFVILMYTIFNRTGCIEFSFFLGLSRFLSFVLLSCKVQTSFVYFL